MSTFSEADPANNMETDLCANLWQLNAHCRRPIHAKLQRGCNGIRSDDALTD